MELNQHNKAEFPPSHTAEHLLNGTMVKMFGCPRSPRAHVERTKSKLDYPLPQPLTDEEIAEVERRVNEQIAANLPVVMEFMPIEEAARQFNLDRLPDDASSTVRIVRIGDYDSCPCIGAHVEHTAEIGTFRISSSRYADGWQRLVFRLTLPDEL